MQGLAKRISNDIFAEFGREPRFNALHLRLERDYSVVHDTLGGAEPFFQRYLSVLRDVALTRGAPLYLATGLMHSASEDPREMSRLLHYAAVLGREGVRRPFACTEGVPGELLPCISIKLLLNARMSGCTRSRSLSLHHPKTRQLTLSPYVCRLDV